MTIETKKERRTRRKQEMGTILQGLHGEEVKERSQQTIQDINFESNVKESRDQRRQEMKSILRELHVSDKEKVESGIPLTDHYLGQENKKTEISEFSSWIIVQKANDTSVSVEELGAFVRNLILK